MLKEDVGMALLLRLPQLSVPTFPQESATVQMVNSIDEKEVE